MATNRSAFITGGSRPDRSRAERQKAAHSFNFALDDLGSGTHTVRVFARVTTDRGVDTGTASATGLVGKGSVTVEEVRLVKDIDITR